MKNSTLEISLALSNENTPNKKAKNSSFFYIKEQLNWAKKLFKKYRILTIAIALTIASCLAMHLHIVQSFAIIAIVGTVINIGIFIVAVLQMDFKFQRDIEEEEELR